MFRVGSVLDANICEGLAVPGQCERHRIKAKKVDNILWDSVPRVTEPNPERP